MKPTRSGAHAHKMGASKSLNKTITEIMELLGDEGERGGRLRPLMHEKIGDLVERFYRKGFNRGHRESFAAFEQIEEVPRLLEFECTRTLAKGETRDLYLESKIPSPRKTKKKR